MNLCDISTVKKIMAKHQTGTKKSFGQNFLINIEVPQRIAEESYSYHKVTRGEERSAVIEIGPGIGCLTNELASLYDKVIAVEIDSTLIPILNETLNEHENVKVINEDFLKLDLDALFENELNGYSASVCANLPYYITTPIVMALLERARGKLTSITVMVQREVADRLCASERKGDYGAISASISYYGVAKKLFDVSPDNFLPAPKVTSSVVRIELYDKIPYEIESEELLFKVIQGAFSQRRKTLLNSLSSYFSSTPKEKIAEIITDSGFDLNVRGEKLSISDFCILANRFLKEV